MAFEYNDKKGSVFDQVRKLHVGRDSVGSGESVVDTNQISYKIFDENGNQISKFTMAIFWTASAENAPRYQTFIILHNTIVPHQRISVEFIAEAFLVLVGKGKPSKEEFITIELAVNMFAAQEKYPGKFPGFEHWARCCNYPISDGSSPPNPDSIKVLYQFGKPCLNPQERLRQPDAGSYYPGWLRSTPLANVDTRPVTQEIRNFTVSLAVDQKRAEIETSALIGFGTLVAWKSKNGILTASHVIEQSGLRAATALKIGAGEPGEFFDLPVSSLQFHTMGQYQDTTAKAGPDLAIIEIPAGSPQVQSLIAKRPFYNLGEDCSNRIKLALNGHGLVALVGTLEESRRDEGTRGDRDQVPSDIFVAYSPERAYSKADEFDYFDVTVVYKGDSLPQTYQGMNGGGLWKIPMTRCPSGEIKPGPIVLAGMSFYQFPVGASDRGIIRCHGIHSINKILEESAS